MKITRIAHILCIIGIIILIAAAISFHHNAKVAESVADSVQQVVELTTTAELTTVEETTATETTMTETHSAHVVITEQVTVDFEQGEHTTPLGRFYITGYTAEEGFGYGSATASGVGCRPGICAMNNQQRKELGIQYGDTIYIKDLGSYQVQDCGCGYGVVDIWMNTNAQAYAITGYYEVYI